MHLAVKYNWTKQEIKGEEVDFVMDNKYDMIKNETCNLEGIKQDPEHYFGCLDVKPVLFKQELTAAGNGDSDDEQPLVERVTSHRRDEKSDINRTCEIWNKQCSHTKYK